ncbi:MAG: type II toxin-antitoxin system VapC family toxin [Chloroflexi bacterium]|nr:type II toxin-antitoxin system VapC family toxin [Chloroflexota bacterium]
MYAGGADHPLQSPARRVIRAIVAGAIDAVTDAEVFQEILYRYLHIGAAEKGYQVFDHFFQIMSGRILAIEDADVRAARELSERYRTLGARDLIHLAVMTRRGITEIITTDEGFAGVAEVHRINPASLSTTMGDDSGASSPARDAD